MDASDGLVHGDERKHRRDLGDYIGMVYLYDYQDGVTVGCVFGGWLV